MTPSAATPTAATPSAAAPGPAVSPALATLATLPVKGRAPKTGYDRELFGSAVEVKFLPHYFPFTEPSAEMHVLYRGSWLELLGCGMVHPAVFEHVGYDPAVVTGFAFGMGADRVAMVRHGVTDIRHLFDPDLRILGQFR